MGKSIKNPLNIIKLRGMVGLFQGFILYLLYKWPPLDTSFYVPMIAVALVVPLLIVQGLGNLRLKTLLIWSTSVAIVLAGIFYYAVIRQDFYTRPPEELVFFTLIALFVSHTLILSGDHDRRVMAHYSTYFDVSWKLAVQIVFTLAFTVFFWVLLALGMGLFELIHIKLFSQIITQSWFAISVTTLAISMALHITDMNVSIVRGIRTLSLVLFSSLLPLITAIISLFFLSLCFTGLTPLWQTGYASALLLVSASILIILINTSYQNGQHEKPLSILQYYSTNVAACLLVPIVALAIYALNLRVQQYGWSVQRLEAAAWMTIVTFYAIGYALAVFVSRGWFTFIECWNFAAACLVLITYLALFTPIADPARLMVISQLSRLESGKIMPDKFDFKALRLEGLSFGVQALKKLQTTWQGPQVEYVRTQTTAVLKINTNRAAKWEVKDKKHLIIAHTSDGQLPASFIEQKWDYIDGDIIIPDCLYKGTDTCQAWMMNDNQKIPIIIILGKMGFIGFQQNPQGTWKAIGRWDIPSNCKKLHNNAAEGKFKMVAPLPEPQADIEILGWRAKFEKNNVYRCK
jgi:hypothetical protein